MQSAVLSTSTEFVYLKSQLRYNNKNRNSFIAWASDFYGHNDLDIVSPFYFGLQLLIQRLL